MNTSRRVALAATVIAAMTGCGMVVNGPAARPSTTPAPAQPTAAAARGAAGPQLDFSRPSIMSPVLNCDGPLYAGKLTLDGLLQGVGTAAIVTLDSQGTARWNTADGHRWTVAEAQAAIAAGIRPWLFTPWTLHRSGPVLRGTLPSSLTAYVGGGTLGADQVHDCGTGHLPVAGGSFLAEFVTDQSVGTILVGLMPYDPATRTVHTPFGLLTLPSTSG